MTNALDLVAPVDTLIFDRRLSMREVANREDEVIASGRVS